MCVERKTGGRRRRNGETTRRGRQDRCLCWQTVWVRVRLAALNRGSVSLCLSRSECGRERKYIRRGYVLLIGCQKCPDRARVNASAFPCPHNPKRDLKPFPRRETNNKLTASHNNDMTMVRKKETELSPTRYSKTRPPMYPNVTPSRCSGHLSRNRSDLRIDLLRPLRKGLTRECGQRR